MSYDYRRLLFSLLIIPDLYSKIKLYHFNINIMMDLKLKSDMNLNYEVLLRQFNQEAILSIGGLFLSTMFILLLDYQSYGVVNDKGIFLHRFIKYKKMIHYHVDREFNFIEINYKNAFGKSKYRYLKMSNHELNEVSKVLRQYVKVKVIKSDVESIL